MNADERRGPEGGEAIVIITGQDFVTDGHKAAPLEKEADQPK
jgi:hypothetical protein